VIVRTLRRTVDQRTREAACTVAAVTYQQRGEFAPAAAAAAATVRRNDGRERRLRNFP